MHLLGYCKPGFQTPVAVTILSAGAIRAGVIDEISTYYPHSFQAEHSTVMIEPSFQSNV